MLNALSYLWNTTPEAFLVLAFVLFIGIPLMVKSVRESRRAEEMEFYGDGIYGEYYKYIGE